MTVGALPQLARQAGVQAERQMAFYLRRAFDSSGDYQVLNNVRIEVPGDAAQIDHLVISRWGLVIVESKSVSTRVRVNERGEWTRLVEGSWQGMPSPILQAIRQKDFLRAFLGANKAKLLGRIVLFGQKGFENYSMDVMVAVSDRGIIDRVGGADPKEVFKADQIPMRIKELLEARRREIGGILSLASPYVGIETEERAKLADFLRDFQRPLEAPPYAHPATAESRAPRQSERREMAGAPLAPRTVPPPIAARANAADPVPALQNPQPQSPAPRITAPLAAEALSVSPTSLAVESAAPATTSHRCRHCSSGDLAIRWGKYGYYLKCSGCAGNTPLPAQEDGSRPTLRKENLRFYRMKPDGSEELYFVNPTD